MKNDSWNWLPGKVDLDHRYFELKFGFDPLPVARVGIGENKNFIVEFLLNVNDDTEKLQEIFSEVLWEIELYLINNNEPDPIEYMITHTKKCANMYSKVHWRYFPKGFKRPIMLSKENIMNSSAGTFKKFLARLID
jgi:hypothetical protein